MALGIFRLFITLLSRLGQSPDDAMQADWDELAGAYSDFAHIGSRCRLKSVVLSRAERLSHRLQGCEDEIFQRTLTHLALRLWRCRWVQSPEEAAMAWTLAMANAVRHDR
jgi:hypothetical protein